MQQYTVQLGKIMLQSDKPITPEEQKAARAELKKTFRGAMMHTRDGLLIVVADD